MYCTITFHKIIKLTQNQFPRERTKISFEARMTFFTTRPAVDVSVYQGRVSKNVRTSFRLEAYARHIIPPIFRLYIQSALAYQKDEQAEPGNLRAANPSPHQISTQKV
jgi:hypothetical protein